MMLCLDLAFCLQEVASRHSLRHAPQAWATRQLQLAREGREHLQPQRSLCSRGRINIITTCFSCRNCVPRVFVGGVGLRVLQRSSVFGWKVLLLEPRSQPKPETPNPETPKPQTPKTRHAKSRTHKTVNSEPYVSFVWFHACVFHFIKPERLLNRCIQSLHCPNFGRNCMEGKAISQKPYDLTALALMQPLTCNPPQCSPVF